MCDTTKLTEELLQALMKLTWSQTKDTTTCEQPWNFGGKQTWYRKWLQALLVLLQKFVVASVQIGPVVKMFSNSLALGRSSLNFHFNMALTWPVPPHNSAKLAASLVSRKVHFVPFQLGPFSFPTISVFFIPKGHMLLIGHFWLHYYSSLQILGTWKNMFKICSLSPTVWNSLNSLGLRTHAGPSITSSNYIFVI